MAASGAGSVRGTVARLLGPRWLAMHALVCAAVVVMVELGRWQLRVSERKHFDLQNFSYVLQWWAFAAATFAFWLRAMYNVHRPPAAAEPTGGALVVRGGAGALDRWNGSGPTELVAPARAGGQAAVYRGYVIAQSSQVPHRSEGDSHHALYNDYLWQLSMADAAAATDRPTFYPRAQEPATEPAPAPQDPPGNGQIIDASDQRSLPPGQSAHGEHGQP